MNLLSSPNMEVVSTELSPLPVLQTVSTSDSSPPSETYAKSVVNGLATSETLLTSKVDSWSNNTDSVPKDSISAPNDSNSANSGCKMAGNKKDNHVRGRLQSTAVQHPPVRGSTEAELEQKLWLLTKE